MNRVVMLDTGPLGLVTNPRRSPQSVACAQWLQGLVEGGVRVVEGHRHPEDQRAIWRRKAGIVMARS